MEKELKIFCTGYYSGLFLLLPQKVEISNKDFRRLQTRILFKDGRKDFGKMTLAWHHRPMSLAEAVFLFPYAKQWLEYIHMNYHKFWCKHLLDVPQEKWHWNDVCHHIGSYRRVGNRMKEDGWKIQVCGLNPRALK